MIITNSRWQQRSRMSRFYERKHQVIIIRWFVIVDAAVDRVKNQEYIIHIIGACLITYSSSPPSHLYRYVGVWQSLDFSLGNVKTSIDRKFILYYSLCVRASFKNYHGQTLEYDVWHIVARVSETEKFWKRVTMILDHGYYQYNIIRH